MWMRLVNTQQSFYQEEDVSRKASERQEERKTAHQPEYTIIKRAQRSNPGTQHYQAAPTKSKPGKKSAALEEKLSKRELLREKQYDAKRRRQWALALGVIILFIGIAAAALHFITNRPTTSANTACNNSFPSFTGTSATINQVVQSSMASTLGISPSTLQSDLASGESLADIAQAQNKQMSDVNAAYLNALQNELNTLVSANEMTQDQANQLYTQEQTNVNNGQYTYLQSTSAGGSRRFGACPTATSGG